VGDARDQKYFDWFLLLSISSDLSFIYQLTVFFLLHSLVPKKTNKIFQERDGNKLVFLQIVTKFIAMRGENMIYLPWFKLGAGDEI